MNSFEYSDSFDEDDKTYTAEDTARDTVDEKRKISRGFYEIGTICAYLLRGVIYRSESPALWNSLINQQSKVHDYLFKLGVKLMIDDNEGYAYLRSLSEDEMPDVTHMPPKLMMRRQLSFNVSFLLLLLRHKLIEFDSESNGDMRLVMTQSQLVDLLKTYYKVRSNDVKLQNQLESTIGKVCDLGFLKPLKDKKDSGEQTYEVMRIIKAYFDAQTISDFKVKLEEYLDYISQKNS